MVRAATTTSAPASARASAKARPSPRPAPVTSATSPASENRRATCCMNCRSIYPGALLAGNRARQLHHLVYLPPQLVDHVLAAGSLTGPDLVGGQALDAVQLAGLE